MAYITMSKDFSTVKKTIPGLGITKRQVLAIVCAALVGIPVFLLLYLYFGLDLTMSTLGLFIAGGPVAFIFLFEKYNMGMEKWGKLIFECKVSHNTDRPYMTDNLYDLRERNLELSREVEKIMYKDKSKQEIRQIKKKGLQEIKVAGKKIKVPMVGKIDSKTKKELEKAVKKAKVKGEIPESAQDTIPYKRPYKDGIFEIETGYYTKTIRFEDITYQLLDNEPKDLLFERWCNLINYFDPEIHFQFNYGNMEFDKDMYASDFKLKPQNDEFEDIRNEYSDMLTNQFSKGTNNLKKERYLTYGIKATDLKTARQKMAKIDKALQKYLRKLDCKSKILDGTERLELLYRFFHPATKDRLFWNWDMPVNTGLSSKDFICPNGLSFKNTTEFNNTKYFKMGERIGAVSYLNVFASEMEDRIIADILNLDSNVWISIHSNVIDRNKALDYAKDNITDLQGKIMKEQKVAFHSGYDMDLLPPELKAYSKASENLFHDLQSKDEQLFNTTITIVQTANTRKELENNIFELNGILSVYQCKLERLNFQQERGFTSALPLGFNNVEIKRTYTTNDMGIFIPFTTKELFTSNGQYYGMNSLSNNVVMIDRKQLVNPNGLVFGMPGFGKTFFVKREIMDTFLKTKDDRLIIDPEGEYKNLVYLLNGKVVPISLTSDVYINPMEINLNARNDDDVDFKPIYSKCSFIVSLCNLILGGKAGRLTEAENSCIDRACQKIYGEFAANPSKENMPILSDLYRELNNMDSPFENVGKGLAASLSRYVNGSLSYFNHQSSFDINSRLICFDLKEMNAEQRELTMFIIMDLIWSRVAENRSKHKFTWVDIDEFHLLLRNPSTAEYSVEIYKRFRKWGGIPTGITQNIKDLFRSSQIQNILDTTNFIAMLNQAGDDERLLAEHLDIMDDECTYLHTGEKGKGLLWVEGNKVPFEDEYPKDTLSYKVMTTDPKEVMNDADLRKLIDSRLEK